MLKWCPRHVATSLLPTKKIPRINPMRVLYEIHDHPWCWNYPQFYHNLTFLRYQIDLFYKGLWLTIICIELWLELPSLEKIGRIISNLHWLCPSSDKFILNINTFSGFRPKQLLAYIKMVSNAFSKILITLTKSLEFTIWGYFDEMDRYPSIILTLPSISAHLTLLGCLCNWFRWRLWAMRPWCRWCYGPSL